jgi:hypothetical protein
MSQKTVQWLIGRLLSDEECRIRFLSNPLGTLVALRDLGYELTLSEIEALVRTDRALWIDGSQRLDPHLQRCSIRPGDVADADALSHSRPRES